MITQIDVSNGEDQTILSLKVNGEMILFVPKSDYDKLQSRVKELSEENERLKSALTPLLETMDFIQRNHNVMNVHAHAKLAIEKFDKALSGKDGVDETV